MAEILCPFLRLAKNGEFPAAVCGATGQMLNQSEFATIVEKGSQCPYPAATHRCTFYRSADVPAVPPETIRIK